MGEFREFIESNTETNLCAANTRIQFETSKQISFKTRSIFFMKQNGYLLSFKSDILIGYLSDS